VRLPILEREGAAIVAERHTPTTHFAGDTSGIVLARGAVRIQLAAGLVICPIFITHRRRGPVRESKTNIELINAILSGKPTDGVAYGRGAGLEARMYQRAN
jgi:hypothetical protein